MWTNTITCVVCAATGTPRDIHATGWRLAPSRPGGYTCSKSCDDLVVAYDAEQKRLRDEAKKLRKAANLPKD